MDFRGQVIVMKLTKIDLARIKQADKELAYKRTLEKKQDDSLKSIIKHIFNLVI